MDKGYSKTTSHLCGICKKPITETNMYVYPCETCFDWLHARCLFPSATEKELKVLFKFSHAFQVKCRPCRIMFFETVRTATKPQQKYVMTRNNGEEKDIAASESQEIDISENEEIDTTKKSKAHKFPFKFNKNKK